MKAWEEEQQTRDTVSAEIKTKQEELEKLNGEKTKLDEEIKQKK